MPQPTIETKIWKALESRLDQFVSKYPRPIPFAKPGQIFTPSGLYVRVDLVINRPSRMLVSLGPHDRQGLLSLTVSTPLSATGDHALDLAGELAEHFPPDTPFCFMDTCVCVPAEPHVHGGFQDSGTFQVPVDIQWRCFA